MTMGVGTHTPSIVGGRTHLPERIFTMAANITRTIATVKVWGLIFDLDENGNAVVTKTDEVTVTTTNPNDVEAYKVLKANGIKIDKKFVRWEIVSEQVYAMSLDEFIEYAHIVERGKGGYIKKSQMTDSETE